jgi:hypothetical protein
MQPREDIAEARGEVCVKVVKCEGGKVTCPNRNTKLVHAQWLVSYLIKYSFVVVSVVAAYAPRDEMRFSVFVW